MRTAIIPPALILVLMCSVAQGNDTFATMGAGGLVPVKTTQVVMQSEDLRISVHRIEIHYVFRNSTEQDIDAVVAFPLPDLSGETLYYVPIRLPDKNSLNFLAFRVSSGGNPIPVEVESRAFLEGRDVTARLGAAGLPAAVLPDPLNVLLMRISPGEREKLVSEGLIEEVETGKPGWVSRWAMRIQFYWTQKFPAHQAVELEQTYQPVVGGSYITTNDDGSSAVKPYCGGPDTLRQIAEIKRRFPHSEDGDVILRERTIDYILTTGNNWSGPIRDFHLSVLTDDSDDIPLTCMQGLKRVGPTRYEFRQSDFHPNEELKLMILQTNKLEGH